MANLNLSQFGENTSVSDADYTFVWDSANAISKKVSRNSWLNSGTLTSSAPVTISQTWGTTGTYTAAKVNVTETATANAASLLLDLQLGSVSRVKVNKEGNLVIAAVSGAMIQCTASSQGILSSASAFPKIWGARFDFQTAAGGTTMLGIGPTQVEIPTQLVFNTDTILLRDSASGNTLALRNGTSAQTFNVYGTYTSGSVYERMFMRYNGTDLAFQVGAETLGATARPLQLWTGGASRLHITTAGNVGIGTTAPTANLEVASTTSAQVFVRSATGAADGTYVVAQGQAESYFYLISKGNLTGSQVMRFGNANSSNFVIQALNDANTSLSRTPVSISNAAPTGSLQILSSGNVGIGTTSPTSKLQVSAGDVEVDTIAKGVILKSPDGTRYRVTVANGGTLSVAAV